MKRIGAAIKIQKFYKKFQDRRRHIENLRRKNLMKKLKEEEDDKFYNDQEKKKAAAKTILKYW